MGTERHSNKLVRTADRENGDLRLNYELTKRIEVLRVVVVEIAERSAQDYRIGNEIAHSLSYFGQVYRQSFRILDKTDYILRDVVAGERRDLAFATQLILDRLPPFPSRERGKIRRVAKETVHDQHACVLDPFLDRLIMAESPPIIWKRQFFRDCGSDGGVKHKW